MCKVHLKITVYFLRNKQRTLKKFLRQNWVPTKLQKSCWLEAHWVFSITPQKMQQKSWFQGIFGVWIWNTKFRLDKGECLQQKFHWTHSPTDSKYFTLKTQVNWDGGKNLSGDGSRSKVLYRPKHFQCCNPMQKLMTRSQPENFGKTKPILKYLVRRSNTDTTGQLLWKDTKNPRKINP